MNLLNVLLTQLTLNNLDAYIIYHTDEHLNEFISDADMRVKRLTGFTGSNGVAVVTKKDCVLYTDSRYYIQAQEELVSPFKMMRISKDRSIFEFLKDAIGDGNVGIDLRFISHESFKKLKHTFDKTSLTLVPVEKELFDVVWTDKPNRSMGGVIDLEKLSLEEFLTFQKNVKIKKIFEELFQDSYKYEYEEMIEPNLLPGINYKNKISIVQKALKEDEGMIMTSLDSIAWFLNLRGRDITNNTVFFAYVYVSKSEVVVFTDTVPDRNVKVLKYNEFYNFLSTVEKEKIFVSSKVNAKIVDILGEDKIEKNDSIEKLKSIKNINEIKGFFQAAILDGVALVKLFSWVNKPRDGLTEMGISDKLLEIKSKLNLESVNADSEATQKEFTLNTKLDYQSGEHSANPSLKETGTLQTSQDDIRLTGLVAHADEKSHLSEKEAGKGNNLISTPVESSEEKNKNLKKQNDAMEFSKTGFLFPSFSTIVGYGKNGAIVHHSANETPVGDKSLILIDLDPSFYLLPLIFLVQFIWVSLATKRCTTLQMYLRDSYWRRG